jgi:hypothetical protein
MAWASCSIGLATELTNQQIAVPILVRYTNEAAKKTQGGETTTRCGTNRLRLLRGYSALVGGEQFAEAEDEEGRPQRGKPLAELAGITPEQIESGLSGLPSASHHAAVLAADALKLLLSKLPKLASSRTSSRV